MSSYRIVDCREGFCSQVDSGYISAGCTITLVCGLSNILFDPGSPWDRDLVKSLLNKHGLVHDDIDYVICLSDIIISKRLIPILLSCSFYLF